jgi:hypothetical protein
VAHSARFQLSVNSMSFPVLCVCVSNEILKLHTASRRKLHTAVEERSTDEVPLLETSNLTMQQVKYKLFYILYFNS